MTEQRSLSENRFDDFYKAKGYAALKRSLFNYRLRKWKIAGHVPPTGLILDIGSGIAPVSPDLERTVLADISEEAMKNIALPGRSIKYGLGVLSTSGKYLLQKWRIANFRMFAADVGKL
jgi:hypothetical protein